MFIKKYTENVKKNWYRSWIEFKAQMRSFTFLVAVLSVLLIFFYLVTYIYLIFSPDSNILSSIMNQGVISYWGVIIAFIICITAFKAGKIYRKYNNQFISGSYILHFIIISTFSLLTMFLLTGIKESIELVIFVMHVGATFSYGSSIADKT